MSKRSDTLVKPPTVNEEMILQLTANYLMTRTAFIKGMMDDPRRDLNRECGYPDTISIEDYKLMIRREGIANRANGVYPEESWSIDPLVFEGEKKGQTAFDRRLQEIMEPINEEHRNLWHWCQKGDEASGVGSYGGLLLGVTGGGSDLAAPLSGINPNTGEWSGKAPDRDLMYLRAFDEAQIQIRSVEIDPSSPRFQRPKTYLIRFSDYESINSMGAALIFQDQEVHWTRFFHMADNTKSSPTLGTPRLEPIYNRLMDCRKILSSSAEMFYKGGFPGYSFETHPNIEDPEIDRKFLKEQVFRYMQGLQRYMALEGMTAKSLTPQIADPTSHMLNQLNTICLTLGVPLRIFMGSEQAHLASTQDAQNWNRRLAGRQNRYLTPCVIRPLINRLMGLGVLPRILKYFVEWKDMNALSDKDKADVSMKKSQAMMAYVSSGSETIMSPYHFFTFILGMTEAEADAVVAGATTSKTKEAWKKQTTPTAANMLGKRPPRNALGGTPKQPAV